MDSGFEIDNDQLNGEIAEFVLMLRTLKLTKREVSEDIPGPSSLARIAIQAFPCPGRLPAALAPTETRHLHSESSYHLPLS